jgi:hypothetical protein
MESHPVIKQLLVPCATALVLLPSGSPAQAPCAPVVYYHPCMPVVYYPSVVVAQPVYLNSVVVADCPPAVATVGPTQPTIVPERMAAPKKPDEKKPEEKKSVKVDPPLEFSKPREAEASPIIKPAGNKEKEPAKEPVKEDKIPALDLPTKPAPKPVEKLPEPKKTELPAFELPILPDAPVPAPAPKAPESLPKIDSTALPIPNVVKPQDTPKLEVPPAKGDLNLPSFDIPLPMGEPAKQVEANKTSVSKASPLAAERESRFDLFPVDGAAPASPTAKRMIGFINKSAKDVLLTVDGQSVVLPAKSLIRAELPAKFTWQLGTDDERKETVGSTSPGLDIVIRK